MNEHYAASRHSPATPLCAGAVRLVSFTLLLLLTLPLNILTLGLLTFVINALLIMVTSALVPGFAVEGFLWALLFSLVLSLVSFMLGILAL